MQQARSSARAVPRLRRRAPIRPARGGQRTLERSLKSRHARHYIAALNAACRHPGLKCSEGNAI
jgi:hypothetical protein